MQMSPRVAKRKHEVALHVTYTDTGMCHRFVTCEFARDDLKAREALDDLLRHLYREEQGALLYHKVQEGVEGTPFQEPERAHQEAFFTVCLIFDPEKSQNLRPYLQRLQKSQQ